LIVALFASTVM